MALALALLAFVCFAQPIGRCLVDRVTQRLSNDDVLVSVDSAVFRLTRGLKVRGIKLLRRAKPAAPPVLSVDEADFELDLLHLPWSTARILRAVTLRNLRCPRLADGYYIPDSIEFPGSPDFRERDEPLRFDLPKMDPFRVRLETPHVLGVEPKSVDIGQVSFTPDSMTARGLHLRWPDSDQPMTLDGEVELDLVSQRVRGEVHGQARQHGIRPMLEALEITNSYQFIDAWTEVEPPVDASCRFGVNLRNSDLRIQLDLRPEGGRYNGAALRSVHGLLDIRVFVRDTYQNALIKVGPIDAAMADGGRMSGTVVYENTNDVGYVDFDVDSTTSLSNALAVADSLCDGTLDCLAPQTRPHVTLHGRLAVDPAHAERANNLDGTLDFEKGTFFSVPLNDVSTAFRVRGTTVEFPGGRAKTARGGSVNGSGVIRVPGFKQENASFEIDLKGEAIPLSDLAEIISVDPGERTGTIKGWLKLNGPLDGTNLAHRVGGAGHLECNNGNLAQMKLFAGLTDFLVKHVPGISTVVTQTRGALDFKIEKGVISTDNMVIEGSVFSIKGAGSYDMGKDVIDLSVRVSFTTDHKSLLGKITLPITWQLSEVSKRIFDFRIKGSMDKPELSYNKSILDRLPKLKR